MFKIESKDNTSDVKLKIIVLIAIFLLSTVYSYYLFSMFFLSLLIFLSERNYKEIRVVDDRIEFIFSSFFIKRIIGFKLSSIRCEEHIRYEKIGKVFNVFLFFDGKKSVASIDDYFFNAFELDELKKYLEGKNVEFIVKSKKRMKYSQ